jgi:hypothetical protein
LRWERFSKADLVLLALLPVAGVAFKLTGAGIGVGLVFAMLFERRWAALAVLAGSGLVAMLTVPLFNATLGSFSAYAIRLQASHPMQWWRIESVPQSAPGLIFEVALVALAVSFWARPGQANVRAAARVLLLTGAFGALSLIAFLKQGGRENSLMPFALGGTAALLVLLGELPTAPPSVEDSTLSSPAVLPLVALFWAALSCAWPALPISGEARQALVATHEREVSFLAGLTLRGEHPWSQGTAAWIEAGLRDTPRDRLSSVSELELGHRAEVGACKARLLGGTYDGLFLAASALTDNDFLRRLRPRLEAAYRPVEPGEAWPTGREGYVILARRAAPVPPASPAR